MNGFEFLTCNQMEMTMTDNTVPEHVIAMMREAFSNQGAMQALGARIVSIGRGTAEITLPMSAAANQHHGFFHGGVIGMLGDATGGMAANSLLMPKQDCLAVEFKVNFLAPAIGEALIGRGRVVRAGKTIVITSVDVFSVNGGVEKHCALLQQTLYAIDRK